MPATQFHVVSDQREDVPYPADIRARGFPFEIDWERIDQSDTWTLCPAEIRPWLLMLWAKSWQSAPCGTWPANDELIAARIGMPYRQFKAHRDILMRGWYMASDGRLYHPVIVGLVLGMIDRRIKDKNRVAAWRSQKNQALASDVTRDQRVSNGVLRVSNATTTPTPTPTLKDIQPSAGSPRAEAQGPPPCPIDQIIDAYHQALPSNPKMLVRNSTRDGYIRQRWRDVFADGKATDREDALALFREFFAHVAQSKFLTGRARASPDKPPFVADLEWLMRPTNFAKVVEGKYHR